MASRPPQIVLEAFGVKHPPRPLSGGRGLCFQADGIVLRPSDHDTESEWVGNFLSQLRSACSTNEYQLPRPVRSNVKASSFVYQGWTASTFLTGQIISPIPWQRILRVSRHFHTDIKSLQLPKPDFLSSISDRFHEADLVTWEEKHLSRVDKVNEEVLAMIESPLGHILQLKEPIPDLPVQIIHGDLTGNVLFDDSGDGASSPGIIDVTIYWRPAAYAEAIIVADGLIWHGQGSELLDLFGAEKLRLQLVVRAVYWRCLCFAIDPDMEFVRAHLPKADFTGAAQIIRDAIKRLC